VERLSCDVRPVSEAEATDRSPGDDLQRWPDLLVSEAFETRPASARGVDARWVRGRGLALRAGAEGGRVALVAPARLGTSERPELALLATAPRAFEARWRWSREDCAGGEAACERTWQVASGERVRGRVSLPRPARALATLELALPADAELVLHRALAAPAEAARVLTLFGPGRPPRVSGGSQLEASWRPGEGLRVTIPPDASDPHLNLDVDVDVRDRPVLELHTRGGARGSLDVFFQGALCPAGGAEGVSLACRVRAPAPRDDVLWSVDLGAHPGWKGRMHRLRLDFNDLAGREIVLRALHAVKGSPERGAPEGWRLRRPPEGGPRMVELRAGERLVCPVPAEHEPPERLRLRLPADDAGLAFYEVRAVWRDAEGGSREAAFHSGPLARRVPEVLPPIALAPPSGPPVALEVAFACARNCERRDDPARRLQVAPPRVRGTPSEALPGSDLILIVLDTLRADRLSLYGHARATDPFLARWAREASVYEQVHAVGTRTIPTHAALLSGRYPVDSGARHYGGLPQGSSTLASELARRGVATFALTDGPLVSAAEGFDQGFDEFTGLYEPPRRKFEAFLERVEESAARGERYFGFLHTYAVHEPYSVSARERESAGMEPPSGVLRPVPSAPLRPIFDRVAALQDPAPVVDFLSAEYDAGIAALDRDLAWLLSRLEERGLLDRAVVALTSDHGEEFLEHGRLSHGHQFPHPELTRVPLVVRAAGGGPGRRVEGTLSQVEIADLLLREVGLEATFDEPCHAPGRAAAFVTTRHYEDHPIGEYFTGTVHEGDCQYAEVRRRDGGEVLEAGFRVGDAAACETRREALAEVLACLRRAQERASQPGEEAAGELDPLVRQRLRALGYAE